jgi:hypothetical protein
MKEKNKMTTRSANPTKEPQVKSAAARKVHSVKGEVKGYIHTVDKYMQKEFNLSQPDVLTMAIAQIPAKVSGSEVILMRLFKAALSKERGGSFENYENLNAHPELILYEGYRTIGSGSEIIIKKREGVETSFLEEKIKEGTITDIGLVQDKTAGQKFLSGFLHFLMMGGFLLVLIVIVGIVITISILTK